jgi:membrane protease YdiL (CAAX protease family)
MGISVVLTILFFAGGYVEGTKGTNLAEPVNTDILIIWNYILLTIGIILALVFPLIFLLRKPKQALRSLIIVVAAVVLVFIAYQFLASDELLNLVNYNGPDNVPTTLKIVDTGLFLTYFLLVIAFGAILYHEISSSIK